MVWGEPVIPKPKGIGREGNKLIIYLDRVATDDDMKELLALLKEASAQVPIIPQQEQQPQRSWWAMWQR